MKYSNDRGNTKWLFLCAFCLLGVIISGAAAMSSAGGISGGRASAQSASQKSSAAAVHTNSASSSQAGKASGMRAVWVATTANIDFPSKAGLAADAQKAEIDAILGNVKKWGMNAVFFQVRANADSLYRSDIYPWSAVLTGKQGSDPGYDPLEYFIQQAHKNSIKLYAWVNPYRVSASGDLSKLSAENPASKHTDWVVKDSDNQLYFNPGIPEVRQMVENGIMEIVSRYHVDGIVFDDYFYPGKDFGDQAAFEKYAGKTSLEDWRRQNVTALVSEIHSKIAASKKNVPFGISPFAVWANASSNPLGSDTAASVQSYYDQFADTRLWVQKKYVDFICPQIYWSIGFEKAAYNKVMDWWASTVKGTGVALYVAQTVSKVGSQESGWDDPNQLIEQIQYSAKSSEYKGSAFFSYSKLIKNSLGVTDRLSDFYAQKSSK